MEMKDKLKELRKQRKYSQRELAEIIGVRRSSVAQWENGKGDPSMFNCILLAEVYNVSLDELCCRDFKGGK